MANEVMAKVCAILVNDFAVDSDACKEQANLVTDLDLDSLELYEFASALEEAFSMDIGDEEIQGAKTVGDVVSLIESRKSQ